MLTSSAKAKARALQNRVARDLAKVTAIKDGMSKNRRYYLRHRDEILARDSVRLRRRRQNDPVWAERERERNRAYRAANHDKFLALGRASYQKNRTKIRDWQRAYRTRLRFEMLDEYGGRCVCCGETNPGFLTMDHVNGGGKAHLRSLKAKQVGWALKKQGWPKDGFQLLCFNCNCGRARNGGECPHRVGVLRLGFG